MISDLNTLVKEALERTKIMALSTIGPDGSWTSPVHFDYNDKLELSFKSMLDSKHVQNLLNDPRVSVAIFSYPGPEGGSLGLQIKGKAVHLSESEPEHEAHSFKIIPEEVWCFDSRVIRQRQRVDLSTLKL